jgi:hypothetical protein
VSAKRVTAGAAAWFGRTGILERRGRRVG